MRIRPDWKVPTDLTAIPRPATEFRLPILPPSTSWSSGPLCLVGVVQWLNPGQVSVVFSVESLNRWRTRKNNVKLAGGGGGWRWPRTGGGGVGGSRGRRGGRGRGERVKHPSHDQSKAIIKSGDQTKSTRGHFLPRHGGDDCLSLWPICNLRAHQTECSSLG